jgi:hypothetical protein
MVTLVNRAKVSTATTGTGTITLGSAESGYQTFADAGVVDADVVRYVIEDGTNWEIGTGTYTATGTTLSRTVLESSNADAAINLSGSAVVFVGAAAEDLAPVLELYAENPSSPTAPSATGANAVAIGSGANASSTASISIGFNSVSSGLYSQSFGRSATATGIYSTAIGTNTDTTSNYSTSLGQNSSSAGSQAVSGLAAMALGGSYASGTDSFAAAIANNTSSYGATGDNSVAMGLLSKSSDHGSVAIGKNCISDGGRTVALGHQTTASEYYSFAVGALSEALQTGSVCTGVRGRSDVQGKRVHSSSTFSGQIGNCQTGELVLGKQTTDATPTQLTSITGNAASAINSITLPNNSAYAFHGTIVARQQASGGTACAAWKIEGLIRREGSAGTTVLVNSATTILDNTPAWGMALSADTTNGGLKIEVTGAAATNIRWVSTINTSEVTY